MTSRKQSLTSTTDQGLWWENLTKTCVLLAFLITPLMVSGKLSDSWEQPKTLVLAILMSLAWVLYFVTIFRRRTVSWQWHVLDWVVLCLVGAMAISTLTSVSLMTSLWGIGSWSSATLPAVLSFASLYFLSGQLFRSRHDQLFGWTSLMLGTGLALLVTFFQLSHVSLLPSALQSNPLLGTISSSPSHVAIMAALFGSLSLLLWPRTQERWARWGIVAAVTVSWLVVLFFRQPLGWAVFALGMMAVVIDQSLAGKQAQIKLLAVAVGLAALGMLAQLTGLPNHSNLPPVNDIRLDQTTSGTIAWSAFVHRPVLGSGPSTWYQNFVQYRPAAFNQSPYWSLRFVTAGAEWWQQLASGGLVIVVLWFGLLGLSLWWTWNFVRRQSQGWFLASWLIILTVALSGFMSTWSWVLLLWFWACLGLSRARATTGPRTTPLGVMAPLGFSLLILVLVGYWWFAGRVNASDLAYQQGRQLYTNTAPIDQVIARLNTAVQLNPKNTTALTLLANAEITKAQLAAGQTPPPSDLSTLLQPALVHMRQAIAVDPNNPALYEEMNNLLNRLSGAISDVAQEANANFRILEKLEPTNPIHDVGDGQTLMVIRDTLATNQDSTSVASQRQALLDQALAAYARALKKKPDYAQASFALAQAQAVDGKNDEALTTLSSIATTFSGVGQYWAERAAILANLKQQDQADQAFAQAKKLSATDASIYLVYAQSLAADGLKDNAKAVLQDGLKAVPTATTLQQLLDSLK